MQSQPFQNYWLTFADPIFGIVQFNRGNPIHRLLLEVMNTRAFQRLRRIKQMGMAEFVFPNAIHNRFSHSLGATHLMNELLNYFDREPDVKTILDTGFEDTGVPIRLLMLLGIMVHDIGHPPLSHTLEAILEMDLRGQEHDYYWRKQILTQDEEMVTIWERYDPAIPEALFRFLGENPDHPKHFLSDMISSQLDMDRLDYLLRDSHFLGVKYGQIEANRIISCMKVSKTPDGQPVVAVREEALPAVEHYLFGRHQAYKMALHPLDKASESVLGKTLFRFRWAIEHGLDTGHPATLLYNLMAAPTPVSVRDYLRMDDNYLWEAIHSWAHDSQDPLLKELANRLLTHNVFKFVDLADYGFQVPFGAMVPLYEALFQHYESRGLSFEFGVDETLVQPKPLYTPAPAREPIWIQTRARGAVDLAEVSSLPLTVPNPRAYKHLLFVWDSEAKRFLINTLKKLVAASA